MSCNGNIAGTSEASDAQQPRAAVGQVVVRRSRKANFSTEEVDILVREVASRCHVLFDMDRNGHSDVGNASAKAAERLAAWREVAASVNSANWGVSRTVREIRKKWENITSAYRKRQMVDLRAASVLEPHTSAGGRCPMDEVLACARAYQNERKMQQQRPRTHGRTISVITRGMLETFHMDDSCNQMHEESTSSEEDLIVDLEPDVQIESLETPLTFPESDEMDSRTENIRHSNNHRIQGNGGASGVMDGDQGSLLASSNMQNIEQQKLAVLRDILKIETKRLKIEKKRLKIEKIRLKMSQNVQ